MTPPTTSAPAAPQTFTDETLPLRFHFGGRTLGSARLRCRVARVHASRLPADAAQRAPVFGSAPGDPAAVQIPACPIASPLPARAVVDGALRYAPMQGVLRFIRLGDGLDDYFARLPAKGRHEFRRKVKRFKEDAGADAQVVVHRTPDEVAAFHAAARALSARTYQERLLDAGLPDDAESRAALARAAAEDRVRGYLLVRGGRTLAYGLCRAFEDDVLWYEHTGYDPEARALNPGLALLHGMLESLFAEGRFRVLDFGFGDAQYKRETATDVLDVARVWWFRPTLSRRALVGAHAACGTFADAATALVARLGLKERLRRRQKRGGS